MNSKGLARFLTFLALITPAMAFTHEDVVALKVLSPQPTASTLNDAVALGNTIVAVGQSGVAVKSTDGGFRWRAMDRLVSSSGPTDMYGIATDGTRVVTAGVGLAMSTDLQTWTRGTWPGGFRIDIAYGAGTFVAVGRVPNVILSVDGLTWTQADLPEGTINLESIVFAQGHFVAGGAGGKLMRSANGTDWEVGRAGEEGDGWFRDVAFANGRFFAYGDGGLFYTSADGLSWTSETLTGIEQVRAYHNGFYISSRQKRGTDYAALTESAINALGNTGATLVVGDHLVTVGWHGVVGTSPDGITWTNRSDQLGERFSSIAFGNGLFVMVDGASNRLLTSPGGKFWTQRFESVHSLRTNVAFGGGAFSLLTVEKTCVRSVDGIHWEETDVVMPFISDTRGLHYLNGRFVTVGNSGGIASSTDGGLTWETHDVGTDARLADIAFANGVYVVGGFSDDFYTSPDLTNWTPRVGVGGRLVLSHAGRFHTGDLTSTDGATWTPYEVRLVGSTFASDPELGIYSLLGSRIQSNNGMDPDDLTTSAFDATATMTGLAEGNGVLVAVGNSGLVMTTATASQGGYAGWVEANLSDQPALLQGPDADPDGDKVTNLEEYVRGTDPNGLTPPLAIRVHRGSFGPDLNWSQRESIVGVRTSVEYSTDLMTWSTTGVSLDVEGETPSARVTGEAGASPELFVRVSWTLE